MVPHLGALTKFYIVLFIYTQVYDTLYVIAVERFDRDALTRVMDSMNQRRGMPWYYIAIFSVSSYI